MDSRWKSYEEVATYLLSQVAKDFGLSCVEGKQTVDGKQSGTRWTLDAKGLREVGEGFVIIECRRYTTSKQNQESIGGLAWRILDADAEGGILVSPLGLQRGAQKVANAGNIISVELDANSTPHEFAMRFLNKLFVGIHERLTASDHYELEVLRRCARCGEQYSVKQNEWICPVCCTGA